MLPSEGGFASRNPRATILAGSSALRAAEPDGIAVGRFGWADIATGFASNSRTASDQMLGFIAPVIGGWQRVYISRGQRWLRPGLELTLFASGDFWAKFSGGSIAGQSVYASLVDGSAISGYAAGAELTPWYVVNSVAPGQLAIISTWSKVT